MRPKTGRIIAGVAKGLANYFGVSVAVVRIVWLLLILPGGLPGLVPYLILWLVMPVEMDKVSKTSGAK